MWDRPGGWHTVDHGWWPGLIHELVPLLFLAAFVLLAVWAVRRITDERRLVAAAPVTPGAADSAIQELRLRYARGELDRDEFVQRVRDLGGEGPEPPPPTPPAAA